MKKTLLIIIALTTIQTTIAQFNLDNQDLVDKIIAINHQNANRALNMDKEVLTKIVRLEHGTTSIIQIDTFEYDNYGRTLVEQKMNNIQPMYNNRREYVYDANGIVSTITTFDYDSGSSSFVYSYKYQVTEYNSSGLPYVVTGSNYMSSISNWKEIFKDTIGYDAFENRIASIQYNWDNSLNNWKPLLRVH